MSAEKNNFDLNYKKYEEVRPKYPPQLFEDIFSYKEITPASRVFEIGIGTGKATLPFLETQCQVASVEPGKKMAKFVREKYKDYDYFSCYEMPFEKYMGFNNTFDLIYSATAFHWLEEESAYKKVFSLLKSGGALARFAYHAGEDISRPELAEEIRQLYNEYMGNTDYKEFTASDAEAINAIAASYGFTDNRMNLYKFKKDFTDKEYIKLLETYPDHYKIEDEKRKKFFKKIQNAIKKHGGTITVHYTVDLHLHKKP